MSKVEKAVEFFCAGGACSQSILVVYGEGFGLPRDQAARLASGFAGGMRLGETCGVVTAAFMVLGLARAGQNCDKPDGRGPVYSAMREFITKFEHRNNVIVCRQLLGCDVSTPDGARKATQEGLFRTICPRLVQDAAEILEEML